MIFNFIHNRAVAMYKTELENLLKSYSSLDKNKIADYFVYSVWTRAGLQNEGLLNLPPEIPKDSTALIYPTISSFEKIQRMFEKRGSSQEAAAISIWIHSLRAVINKELEEDTKKLWALIAGSKEFWDTHLNKLYEEDKGRGVEQDLLDRTLALSKKILKDTPPEQFR